MGKQERERKSRRQYVNNEKQRETKMTKEREREVGQGGGKGIGGRVQEKELYRIKVLINLTENTICSDQHQLS